MKPDAIRRVSEALRDRITAVLQAQAGVIPDAKVVIAPPGQAGADAHLVLFPYKLMASQPLRNEWRTVLTGDPAKPVLAFNNALPLDVYFLITIGQPPAGPAEPALLEGYRYLGFAMRALQLDPFLMGPNLDGDTVRLSLEPANSEEMNRIWALFPSTDYRLSVIYVASPVWIDPDTVDEAERVIDEQHLVGVIDDERSR